MHRVNRIKQYGRLVWITVNSNGKLSNRTTHPRTQVFMYVNCLLFLPDFNRN